MNWSRWRFIDPADLLLESSQDSRHKHTVTALLFAFAHSEGAEMKLPTGVFYSIEPQQMVLQLTLLLVALFQVISFRELVYMYM